jgi:hypothetical protein
MEGCVAIIEDGRVVWSLLRMVWCCMMIDGMVMIEDGRVGGVAVVEDGMVLYDDGWYGHD